jgi:mannonate dehydratase
MVYDPDAPPGEVGPVSQEQILQRLTGFLQEMIPVAEEAGVRLAAHPDDPPLATVRGAARPAYQPHLYERVLDIVPSRSNTLELCVGTVSEMTEGNPYDLIDSVSKRDRIGYIHLRNVVGKVPHYDEVFIDEGDTDMVRVLQILAKNNFDGVLIPDHTPQMTCDAPWHAGMAYALGWMRGTINLIERGLVK